MRCTSCREVVRPVAAIDIDGTLGDHHGHFQEFTEAYVGYELGDYETERRAGEPARRVLHPYPYDVEFSDWLGLPKPIYRDAKLAYRQGGMKRLMPVHVFASEMIANLRGFGVEVWLCTTRPYQRLDNIDPDTREWLRRHQIDYDGLIYGEDKYERLADIVGPERVIAVLDDLPEMFDAAVKLGLWAIQKVNGHQGAARREPSARTLSEAARLIEDRAREWRRENE